MIEGIDVSHHNNVTGFGSVYGSGIDFVICKAIELCPALVGTSYKDHTFDWKMKHAQDAGLITGGYLFYHPGQDPIQQADLILSAVQPYLPCLIAADFEIITGGEWDQVDQNSVGPNIVRFLREIAQNVAGMPGVYEGTAFHNQYYHDLDLSAYWLWLARYAKAPGSLPPFFTSWTMWQHDDHGTVPGIAAPMSVDLDVFNGDLQALQSLQCSAR